MSKIQKKEPRDNDIGVKLSLETKDGNSELYVSGRKGALSEVFGTKDEDIQTGLIGHCLKVLNTKEASGHSGPELQFMVSAVADFGPKDAVERLLAVQMAATHVAMIRVAGHFARAEHLAQYEAYDRAYNKLARTFTTQIEALRKHRNGGKQTVTVQHVNVGEGGQAIVGNVKAGGGAAREK